MRGRWFLLVLLVVFRMAAADTDAAAVRAAKKWLAVVDAGRYGESWDQASSAFREAITKEKWVEAVTSVRTQVGKFESRMLAVTQPMNDPPNAPPGHYIIIEYTSNFANKNAATETVVMALDHDKRWRTSGYFVK
jgi:Protein of unknown function (DUF4019)